MGRERYRRLPRTIVWTIVAILAFVTLFVYSESLRRRRDNYWKLAAETAKQQGECETEALRQTAFADAKLEWAETMLAWAQELESEGESQRAKEVRAQVNEKTQEAANCRLQATLMTRLAEFKAALSKKYQAAAKNPLREPEPDPTPPF